MGFLHHALLPLKVKNQEINMLIKNGMPQTKLHIPA
jgi:hypothetical protein